VARGCGTPGDYIPGINCEEFQISGYTGQYCTCDVSWCNNYEKSEVYLSRAESGITGTGLTCHVCSGDDNLCTSTSDEGSQVDCGEGVSTCLLGKSNDGIQIARGCGLKGSQVALGCNIGTDFTVCMCNSTVCNSATNTAFLFSLATTTLEPLPPGVTRAPTTTTEETVTVDMAVLVRLVESAEAAASEALQNSTNTPAGNSSSNSTEATEVPVIQEIDFAALVASNIPELATLDITGKCAFLADGSEVALTTVGVTGYSDSNNEETEIAKIDDCTDSGGGPLCLQQSFIILILYYFYIDFKF